MVASQTQTFSWLNVEVYYDEFLLTEEKITGGGKEEIAFNLVPGEGTVDMAKTRLVNIYLTIEKYDKALELLRELRTILPESQSVDLTISRIFHRSFARSLAARPTMPSFTTESAPPRKQFVSILGKLRNDETSIRTEEVPVISTGRYWSALLISSSETRY